MNDYKNERLHLKESSFDCDETENLNYGLQININHINENNLQIKEIYTAVNIIYILW